MHVETVWATLSRRTAEEATTTVEGEVADFRNLFAEPIPVRRQSLEELEPMLSLCEIFIVHMLDLASICCEHLDGKQDFVWPEEDGPQGTLMLETLATTLANTLLGVRQLTLMGLDAQARMLLRSLVEVADLAVAASYDYECFINCAHSSVDPDRDRQHWSKYLRPKKIRAIISRLEQEAGLPEEHVTMANNVRLDMYQWLSLYSHANFLGQAISSPAISETSKHPIPKLGDGLDQVSGLTAFEAAFYSWLTCSELTWLFHRRHKWIRLVNKENASRLGWFHYRAEVIKHFAIFHYDNMNKKIDEIDDADEKGESMAELMERITVDSERCGGHPCNRGMRIRVSDVLDLLANGLSPGDIIEEMPDLELEDVRASLRFASRRLNRPVVAA